MILHQVMGAVKAVMTTGHCYRNLPLPYLYCAISVLSKQRDNLWMVHL